MKVRCNEAACVDAQRPMMMIHTPVQRCAKQKKMGTWWMAGVGCGCGCGCAGWDDAVQGKDRDKIAQG